MKRVVILLNMGGVDDLSQVRVFLTNMFNDPYILGIKNRYLRAHKKLSPEEKKYKCID